MHLLLLALIVHIVKPGNTLWGISPGHNWRAECEYNRIVEKTGSCDLIYPGMVVKDPPRGYQITVRIRGYRITAEYPDPPVRKVQHYRVQRRYYAGTLGCYGLERLWESAGGSYAEAFIAAEIAMAESGGRQFATGPVGERGYWQIHPIHGSLSTYDAFGNARAAVIISDNGRNWSPWTTYTSGAYAGRCLHD